MIEKLNGPRGARRRVRPWIAGVAVIAGAATLVACGDSSDDAGNDAAAKKPAATTTAAAAAKPAATTSAPAGTESEDVGPGKVPADVQAYSDAGTMRLAAVWIGTPGKLVVKPKGDVTNSKYLGREYWYPKGTKVTILAKDGKAGRFNQWAGSCSGTNRKCKVTMSAFQRVIAGFDLDAKAAKRLPKDDPALNAGSGT